jgi:hypothetical protein
MNTFEVRFTVQIPAGVEATSQEAMDWLRFYLHDTGTLDGKNPLLNHEPEPMRGTFKVLQTAGFRA